MIYSYEESQQRKSTCKTKLYLIDGVEHLCFVGQLQVNTTLKVEPRDLLGIEAMITRNCNYRDVYLYAARHFFLVCSIGIEMGGNTI